MHNHVTTGAQEFSHHKMSEMSSFTADISASVEDLTTVFTLPPLDAMRLFPSVTI